MAQNKAALTIHMKQYHFREAQKGEWKSQQYHNRKSKINLRLVENVLEMEVFKNYHIYTSFP